MPFPTHATVLRARHMRDEAEQSLSQRMAPFAECVLCWSRGLVMQDDERRGVRCCLSYAVDSSIPLLPQVLSFNDLNRNTRSLRGGLNRRRLPARSGNKL